MTEAPVYKGACHCGAVRFQVRGDPSELTTCDCTLCAKKNALMAAWPQDAFSLTAGEDALALYQWNTGVARHYFCRTCGIYTFHRKRAAPDRYGVNVFCLDGFDVARWPVRATEGLSMSVVAGSGWPGPEIDA